MLQQISLAGLAFNSAVVLGNSFPHYMDCGRNKTNLPFVLEAASAIFWNVSRKDPKVKIVPLKEEENWKKESKVVLFDLSLEWRIEFSSSDDQFLNTW